MDIAEIRARSDAFIPEFEASKAQVAPTDWGWYPYGSLSNFIHLDNLLTGANRDLFGEGRSERLLDIGAADGDTAFFLETLGYQVDVIDNPPTNFNGCRALEALKAQRGSAVTIEHQDLDSQFTLPDCDYDLALVLGLLYHLKNPYYFLETLRSRVDRILLSTRVTRFNRPPEGGAEDLNRERVDLETVPAAYLVDPRETNNDPTNFWIFTSEGLRRLLKRTGWEIEDWMTVGAVGTSDPATAQNDERAFCLARRVPLAAAEQPAAGLGVA
jgi:tRNA (mo5U34)-methyltransferase